MRQIGLGRFLLLLLVVSLGVGLVMLQRRPARGVIGLEVTRLKLVQANLCRAGVLTPKKDKILSARLAALKEWED